MESTAFRREPAGTGECGKRPSSGRHGWALRQRTVVREMATDQDYNKPARRASRGVRSAIGLAI